MGCPVPLPKENRVYTGKLCRLNSTVMGDSTNTNLGLWVIA